jgi:hypothetical protein
MNLRDTWLHRAAKTLVPSRFYPRNVMGRAVLHKTGRSVAAGPFRGMNYVETSVLSVYFPKLLGIYERELHPVVEEIVSLQPANVIDIGAAEGYYAVGLARALPRAKVVAYEQTDEGRELLADMADLNGVSDRLKILGRCEPADLAGQLGIPGRTVVVCDVEGYEQTLLDPAAIPALRSAWLLVELHEFVHRGITEVLRRRFEQTHRITHVQQTGRTREDYPYRSWYTRLLPNAYAVYLVEEFRPERMSWFWLEPLASDARQGLA